MKNETQETLEELEQSIRVMTTERDRLRVQKLVDFPSGYPPSSVISKIGGLTGKIGRLQKKIVKLKGTNERTIRY